MAVVPKPMEEGEDMEGGGWVGGWRSVEGTRSVRIGSSSHSAQQSQLALFGGPTESEENRRKREPEVFLSCLRVVCVSVCVCCRRVSRRVCVSGVWLRVTQPTGTVQWNKGRWDHSYHSQQEKQQQQNKTNKQQQQLTTTIHNNT